MLWLPIDRTANIPLIRQIYLVIRQRILSGELQAHQQLPATRELAAQLGVSRNVVLEAYDQLIAEGYLEGRPGAGTYVAAGACWRQPVAAPALTNPKSRAPSASFDGIDFRSGIPALDQFPRKLWAQLTKQVCSEVSAQVFNYGSPQGFEALRSVLATYLFRTRGVRCQAEQIVITAGASQGFFLLAKLLLSSESCVIVEDPVTLELQQRFSTDGAALYPIPVDEQGLQTELLPADLSPGFILVTPSHQFPLGSVLTIQRRIELLRFAQAAHSWIVEDDYDSEFRYQGTPISSLQGLDPERVIYVGTFSKILSPALRVGYLVLPEVWVDPCCQLRLLDDLHSPSLEQLTLAKLIELGHLDRHIARMKKLYRKRRDALKYSLSEAFGDRIKILGDSTGLHLIAEFADVEFSAERLQSLAAHQVKIYPVERHAIAKGRHLNRIILGYGNLTPEAIARGVERLRVALSG